MWDNGLLKKRRILKIMAKFELNEEQCENLMDSGVLNNLDVTSQMVALAKKAARKSKMIEVNKKALKQNVLVEQSCQQTELAR